MTTRRNFLKQSSMAVAGGLLGGSVLSVSACAQNKMKHNIKKFILILVVFTALSPAILRAADLINKDRWLEIDLYWFERTQMKASSDRFWETMTPLFEDIAGERGIILNIGWMMDFVLEWNGDLNSRIPLPKDMKTENRFSDEGLLLGSTEERRVQVRHREMREKGLEGDLKRVGGGGVAVVSQWCRRCVARCEKRVDVLGDFGWLMVLRLLS
jgi:hypothetical protein